MKFALRLFRPLGHHSPQSSVLSPQDHESAASSAASFAFSLFRPHAKTIDLTDQTVLRRSPTMLAYMRGEPTCPSAIPKTFGFSVFKRDPVHARPFVAPKRPLPTFAFSLFSPLRTEDRGPRTGEE